MLDETLDYMHLNLFGESLDDFEQKFPYINMHDFLRSCYEAKDQRNVKEILEEFCKELAPFCINQITIGMAPIGAYWIYAAHWRKAHSLEEALDYMEKGVQIHEDPLLRFDLSNMYLGGLTESEDWRKVLEYSGLWMHHIRKVKKQNPACSIDDLVDIVRKKTLMLLLLS